MQDMRTQAIEILQAIPEDKIPYVSDILRNIISIDIQELTKKTEYEGERDAFAAFQGLKKYKGCVPSGINEKEELARAREEKYASIS